MRERSYECEMTDGGKEKVKKEKKKKGMGGSS